MQITKLSAKDLHLAQQLILQWQEDDGVLDTPLPSNAYLQKLLASDTFHVYVAQEDGLVVGGLTAYELHMFPKEGTEMFLYEIGVQEQHRKKGIARQLVEHLKTTCKEKGIKTIFVGTEKDNEPAKKLYIATGGEFDTIAWFTYEL